MRNKISISILTLVCLTYNANAAEYRYEPVIDNGSGYLQRVYERENSYYMQQNHMQADGSNYRSERQYYPEEKRRQMPSTDYYGNYANQLQNMPVGSTSQLSNGNFGMVGTVYSDDGYTKLINVRNADGKSGIIKNYRVRNGEAEEITQKNIVFSNLTPPKKLTNAVGGLVQQCGAYGASQMSLDGYTATCQRQSSGSNCSATVIFTRGDQYIGKESHNCN